MKIQSIRQRIGRCTRRHRWVAVCGAALIGAASTGDASAQSPRSGAPSVAGSPHTPAAVEGGQLMHGGESFQVIGSASVPTAAGSGEEIIQMEPGEEFVEWESGSPRGMTHGGHAHHGHGGHSHHGRGPAAPGAVHGAIQGGLHGHAGACGPACQPYHYVTVEGLYMWQTEYDGYRRGKNLRFDEFDEDWAPRVTIGSVPDCVRGWEASFTGPLDWDMEVIGGNAEYDAEYWSAEINRTHIAWDAAKLLLGVRYIDYDEDLSTPNAPVLSRSADNSLIGAQIGMDVLHPVARRVSVDFRGRAGAYLNLVDADVNFEGTMFSRDDEDIAGVFEIGTGLRYHFSDMLSVRGGGELWYLAGMATAPDQNNHRRNEVDTGDEILVLGLTATAELRF